MKKTAIILATLFTTLLLTACKIETVDYLYFVDHFANNYTQAEQISNNRHILYYYQEDCASCETIKHELLSFFVGFHDLEYYLLDTSSVYPGTSSFGEFDGEPIIYLVSNNAVYETYTGVTEIRQFITKYSNIEFDYDLFETQHLDSIYDLLDIEKCDYLVYYYLENCPHCNAAKPYFLPWAFTKNIEDIYFINGAEVEAPEIFPTELIIFKSGTPLLVLMSNGTFANEYYSGMDDVLAYIERIGEDDISSSNSNLDYEDFSDKALTSYDQTLTISDNLHFEYFYSPYCSHCNSIKTSILSFFSKQTTLEYYIIDASAATGTSKIEGFSGVPALYIVYNNEVVEEYIGSYEIPEFIEDYCTGEIDFSQYE